MSLHTNNKVNIESNRIYYICIYLLIAICCPAISLASDSKVSEHGSMPAAELVKQLQQGGLVVYFRHMETDHFDMDSDITDLANCAGQRGLSEEGNEQARLIGKAITTLKIAIDEVYTSPYCRCIDTARFAFSRYNIIEQLKASVISNMEDSKQSYDYLFTKLTTPPAAGKNTILVSHSSNLREVTHIWPKPEGVAHIFRPLASGGYEHLGLLKPAQWTALAEQD